MIGWHRVIYWKMDSLACSGYSGTCFYIIFTIRVCLYEGPNWPKSHFDMFSSITYI